MATTSKLSLSWVPIPPCQTTPGAAATLPCSPDCHHLRQWMMDTSTCSDHCRFRGEGRSRSVAQHACPLFLQIAPSSLSSTAAHCPILYRSHFLSRPGGESLRSFSLCSGSHQLKCFFSFTDPSSSSSPSDARPAGSVLSDALHTCPARRHSVTSWWERSQAISLPGCGNEHFVSRLSLTDLQSAFLLHRLT